MNDQQLIARRTRLLGAKAPLFYEQPLQIVRGEGVWLFGADGKRYLDVYNNVPVVGHCHPDVVAALAKQAATLNVHTRYLHETILTYGEQLTASLDESLSMVFFTCTGSEANEVALRIARSCTGKMGIICTDATYHGNTTAVDELSTLMYDGKTTSSNVRAVPFPDSYRPLAGLSGEALADAYADAVKAAIDQFNEQGIGFAGMLICPIFANEGLPNIPPTYLEKALKHVRDAGGLYISDQVQSGFGRTGRMWGHEISGITPDIITLGKPMGNGHPLAGAITRTDLADEFRDRVMYFNTFGGNPVSCAVGLAVLEVIEREQLVNNAREVGAYVAAGLHKLQDNYDLIGDVRGHGLFFGAELVLDRQARTPAPLETRRIVNQMKDRGILLSNIGVHDNILKMRPPLTFSRDHADLLLSTLDDILAKV